MDKWEEIGSNWWDTGPPGLIPLRRLRQTSNNDYWLEKDLYDIQFDLQTKSVTHPGIWFL